MSNFGSIQETLSGLLHRRSEIDEDIKALHRAVKLLGVKTSLPYNQNNRAEKKIRVRAKKEELKSRLGNTIQAIRSHGGEATVPEIAKALNIKEPAIRMYLQRVVSDKNSSIIKSSRRGFYRAVGQKFEDTVLKEESKSSIVV